jgi:acid stress-induced BolA-like protein IbaG/YrbA
MSPLAQQIEAIIHTAVDNATVYIHDPDGQHLQATVISPTFNGMPLVRQHQLVLNALKQTFNTELHALQLQTYTPEKWEQRMSKE